LSDDVGKGKDVKKVGGRRSYILGSKRKMQIKQWEGG
jgi:hypothetical protein